MQKITLEMSLCVAIIVLTILAIAVFIAFGSGIYFYGLFVICAALMLYTWYRTSTTQSSRQVQTSAPKAAKRSAKKRSSRKRS